MRFVHRNLLQAVGLGVMVGVGSMLGGCDCDCKSGLEISLPNMDEKTADLARVSFRRSSEPQARVLCEWAPPNGAANWICSPGAKSSSNTGYEAHFTYDDDTPSVAWEVTLEGPSGAATKTIIPRSNDPGEGWPGECICYDYRAEVTPQDLAEVGVKTKP